MVDWWTEEDGKEYESRVEVMVEQANKFQVHGQTVKVSIEYKSINELNARMLTHPLPLPLCICNFRFQGKLTSGENIADLGSLGSGLCVST